MPARERSRVVLIGSRAVGLPGLLTWLLAGLLAGCAGAGGGPAEPDAAQIAAARDAGERAYAAHEWATAEPHYRTLVAAIPQDAELWFRLGNIYARVDKPDAAVAAYREALVRDGDLAKAWFNMGVVQLRQAANSFLKLGAHVDPDDPVTQQGTEAYEAIMAILGRHDGASSAAGSSGESDE